MSASASVSVSPSLLLPGVQQRPSSFSGHSSIPLSPSFSSFNIRTRTGVFALNCCLSQPQVPVVNGRIDEGASARDEARLGLPSKGRMADDTPDLLKHWLCFSYWKTEISLVVCLLAEILLKGDDLPPSIPPPVFFCPNLILLVLSMKDCQLSVRQVNPRQYVAEIPQLSNLEVWFQQPKDIVRKLLSGDLDLGIVGLGTVSEYGQGNEDLIVVHDDLEYGDCRLSLAIPKYGIKKTLYRS